MTEVPHKLIEDLEREIDGRPTSAHSNVVVVRVGLLQQALDAVRSLSDEVVQLREDLDTAESERDSLQSEVDAAYGEQTWLEDEINNLNDQVGSLELELAEATA